MKEGRIGTKDGKPLPGADEPLHAYITSDLDENVKKGADRIKKIIDDAINIPDEENDWMREQLRELAVINGTLRDSDTINRLRDLREAETIVTNKILCHMCGGAGHIARDCKQKRPGERLLEMANQQQQQAGVPAQKTQLDAEYMSLMAELGQGPAPAPGAFTAGSTGARPQIHQHQSRVLALPPPTAGPPPPPPPPAGTHPGTRPPFIPSTGVGNIPALGAGRGIVNGGPNVANLATSQPSVTDIAAGALLIASVVQGLTQGAQSNVPPPPPPPSSLWMNSQSSQQPHQYRAPVPPWQQPQRGAGNMSQTGFPTLPPPPPPPPAAPYNSSRRGGFTGGRY